MAMVAGEAYGVALAEGVDVEESECLVGFEDLEAGDLAWCGWTRSASQIDRELNGSLGWNSKLHWSLVD